MYGIIKDVIKRGDYELASMLRKVKTLWAENEISDEQKDELIAFANENANPENSKASEKKQIEVIFQNLAEIALEMKALKTTVAELQGETVEPEETEEYPQWERWNGIGLIPWNEGSTCTHNGKYYLSHVNENHWEPGALGVYDNIWEDITEQVLAEQNSVTEGETE